MNLLDIIIILFLLMLAVTGFKTGVIRELTSLIGIILVFIIAYNLKGVLGNLLCIWLPFINFQGKLVGLNIINVLFYQAVAFIIIFSLLLGIYAILLKVSKVLQKVVNLTIILWLPSKILGAVVSVLKGCIIIFAILLLLEVPFKNSEFLNTSKIANKLLYETPILSEKTKEYRLAIDEIYTLIQEVNDKKISDKEVNNKILDIMLKYKITTKDMIKKLIDLNKLEAIYNI